MLRLCVALKGAALFFLLKKGSVNVCSLRLLSYRFHFLDRADGTVIDMGEVYYNFWYRNRSFVVVNDAPVAMEFLLSSSMDNNDVTELNFSLANTSLKRFSSVTLGPKSRQVRVI